ncbi:MAG: UpxY family transcription antiterminator [Sphingobacteriaceae bacterium]
MVESTILTSTNTPKCVWYVVYTKPRWEKKVASLLSKKGIENYCPLNRVMRQWSDRRKIVEQPLFSGYVFLKTTDAEKWRIKEVDGILNYVHWLGKPAIIPEHEIETIKRFLNEHETVQVSVTNLKPNDKVKILSGAFIDTQARVIAKKGQRVVVEIPSLQMTLTASVSLSELELVS